MIKRRLLILGTMAYALAGCATKFRTYSGPEITRIQVFKEQRKMQLISGKQLIAVYDIELGFAPDGHKAFEGDGRTPEGAYQIDRRNPNSAYHLSLGISYPNARDIANARAQGRSPGGAIFIHGTSNPFVGKDDWTYGCIAVTNNEMEEIYAMVKDGTQIFIYP